jgi:hypothetical protein
MQRGWLAAVTVLLLVNTAAVGLLATGRTIGQQSTSPMLTATQLAQMEKLFRIMMDFHREFEAVVGQAQYADDDEKKNAKDTLQGESFAYSLSKIDYEMARRSRRARDCQQFVASALAGHGAFGSAALGIPSFQRYEVPKYEGLRQVTPGGYTSYGNVSKLESLAEQFVVLAQSLIEDIK